MESGEVKKGGMGAEREGGREGGEGESLRWWRGGELFARHVDDDF